MNSISEEKNLSLLRRRILWKCRRGHLELDLLLSSLYIKNLENRDANFYNLFLDFLSLSDHELWDLFFKDQLSCEIKEKYQEFVKQLKNR